jgi:hypothetical protein
MTHDLSSRQQEYLARSYLLGPNETDGWYYIHLEGEPYEIGFQHGFLLADALREALRVNTYMLAWDTGNDMAYFTDQAEKLWLDKIPDAYLSEMQGIADGATAGGFEVTIAQIIAWNGLEELTDYWWPLELGQKRGRLISKNLGGRCSAFVATGEATQDGKTVMAHETWCTYICGASQNLILDIQPDKGHRILMQGAIGHIDSASDFYITDAGIMCTETTIGGGFTGYDETGAPEFLRSRQAAQHADSIEHWVSILRNRNSGGLANSWLFGSVYSPEIARFELGLKFSRFEKKNEGAYYGCNVASDPNIRNQECTNTQLYYDIRDSGARRVRWIQLMGDLDKPDVGPADKNGKYYGKIAVENAQIMLGDHYDIYLEQQGKNEICKNHPCGHTLCSHLDLDPANPLNHADQPPFYPWGSVDGKVVDSEMAGKMKFWARRGHPCGQAFDATDFLSRHPQYNWLCGYLSDMPANAWHLCSINARDNSG